MSGKNRNTQNKNLIWFVPLRQTQSEKRRELDWDTGLIEMFHEDIETSEQHLALVETEGIS